jgi:hypothetical protein
MRPPKPLTGEEGEVRELTLRDIRRFRPMAEGLSPALATKLRIETRPKRTASARKAWRTRRQPPETDRSC